MSKNNAECLARPPVQYSPKLRDNPAKATVPSEYVSAPPPPDHLALDRHAFFLDLDGTLLEYASRPDEVRADPQLLALLRSLRGRSDGALALVSGRSLTSLDAVIGAERFAAAGLHGFQRRNGGAIVEHATLPRASALDEIRRVMGSLVEEHPSLLLEDKGFALALHYRAAPQLGAQVQQALNALADLSAAGLRLQPGHLVAEVVPAGVNKGSALAEFMREAPFRGRRPVYVGDDLTDEPAFHFVNLTGGVSVVVNPGRPSVAATALGSVAAVRSWLAGLLREGR